MKLENGRPVPTGEYETLEADSLILALGQDTETDFLKLVAIAFVIAVPLVWIAMSRWLEDFAYKADLSWWIFAVAGALAGLIALVTVGTQALKAAVMNPIKSLRTE